MRILVSMATTTKKLRLRRGDRRVLESWVRSRTLPRRQVERAKIVLAAFRGESSRGIAASVGIARDTARLWMRRYQADGLDGIERDRPRPGRPRKITRKVEEDIVQKTTGENPPPEESTHWTSRLMGKALGIDHVSIWRVWRKYGLKPHQIRRFKLSRDPRLVEKLHDVVGVYMNPPDNAVVFSFDEKSQIQALDRTQPGLPLKKGRAGTMTHDYKRHGTTTLFAALNVATGHVIHECMPRHRHQEFLKFIKTVERSVDPDLEIHVILDNYATHKHEKVRNWLARNLRSTSTSSPLEPPGPTSWNASSLNSTNGSSNGWPSTVSPNSFTLSTPTWSIAMRIRLRSSGLSPPRRSSQRSIVG